MTASVSATSGEEMSTLATVKTLREEATDDTQIEKIWEALEAIARKADAASGDAVKSINNSVRGLL